MNRATEQHPVPRAVVIGTGSVGRRHIANLLALGADVTAYSHRKLGRVPGAETVHVFDRLEEALEAPADAVVVANNPDLHVDTALAAARAGRHLFIEKPLSNCLRGVEALAREVESRRLVVETGFMLRFHPNLKFVKTFVDEGGLGDVHYARALFGQYLPEWRPGTDYRQCYSARRGVGGVIFDLTHELDLMAWLTGPVAAVSAMTAHTSLLPIESEALAEIGLRFASGALGQVHVDYLRPVYARTLEIVGVAGVLSWDSSSGTVALGTRDGSGRILHRTPPGFERNDMFLDYMAHFLHRIADPGLPPAASLADGMAALRTALAAHQSALTGHTIDPSQVTEHFSPAELTA